jgi:DNA-binding NarL/FixJ family response regulator
VDVRAQAPTRVLVVDDHSLVREALVQIVALEPGMAVCGEAANGAAAIQLAAALQPDLVILDFALPDMTGLEVAAALAAAGQRPRVLMLTGAPLDAGERELLAGQVDGFAHKEAGRDELCELLRQTMQQAVPKDSSREPAEPSGLLGAGALTLRERAVLREIAKGQPIEAIADLLGITAGTVRKHRENIMAKLAVSSTAALVRAAMQIGRY